MSVDIFTPARPLADASAKPAVICLFDIVPDLALAVAPEDRPLARRALLAPVTSVARGRLSMGSASAQPSASFVVDGLVLRRTTLGERSIAEILGPGDLIDTRSDDETWSVPSHTEYVAHRGATVVSVDDRFRLAARRWPALHDVMAVQALRQVRRASRHLATLALPRVEDRLVALFCDVADRWGRVTVEGIVVEFPVTHEILGEIVGSRRPTVSLAMTELATAGMVVRRPDRRWLIAPNLAAAA